MASTPNNPHTAFQTLPLVDVSGLRSESLITRQATAQQLGQATREAGFLYVTGHGIDPELIEGLVQSTQAFFALPLAEKMQQYIGHSENHSGYVPEGEERFYGSKTVDKKEAYDLSFDMPDPEHRRPMLGENQWPTLPGFHENVKAYYDAVLNLGHQLFRGFALALGLEEDRFTRHINRPPSQLRLIHYPFNPEVAPDAPGIGAHTDYECFTILRPTAPGLEVLNGAGEWIDVPLVDDAFVINIGDMMESLTNGHYVATSHRVRKVAEERYSFPMFCNLDYDTVIEPLPEFVTDTQPARYEPMIAGEHLYAQTVQTFEYLKQRLARGELTLPQDARSLASFGRKTGASQ